MFDPRRKRKGIILLLAISSLFFISVLAWWPFGRTQEVAFEPCKRWELRWISLHNRLRRLAAEGSSQLVFIGDSITENWKNAGESVWHRFYENRQALNLGISSDRTQHILWRVRDTEFGTEEPKLFVLLAGTNNSADDSPEDIAAAERAIIAELHKKAPAAKILLLAILPRGETLDDSRRAVNEATNELLAALAEDPWVTFLDINSEFTLKDGATNLELLPDALHLSEEGYAVWAAAMEPTVSKLLSE